MALAGTANDPREPATTSRAPATDASRNTPTRTALTAASRRAQRPLRHAENLISFHGDTGERTLRASRETRSSTARNPLKTTADTTMTAGRPCHHPAEASVE
jgi:hypothetical protein